MPDNLIKDSLSNLTLLEFAAFIKSTWTFNVMMWEFASRCCNRQGSLSFLRLNLLFYDSVAL